ncbi:MAG: hypothetical protein J6R83_01135, partial [Clostridia bacterium]|nr:hypothetical protein [Clostridia bacterium]
MTGRYYKMIAPSLYDGDIRTLKSLYNGDRSKIVLPPSLMVGDVLVYRDEDNVQGDKYLDQLYIYNGSKLVNLTSTQIQDEDAFTVLQSVMIKDKDIRYVVLRPSLSLA